MGVAGEEGGCSACPLCHEHRGLQLPTVGKSILHVHVTAEQEITVRHQTFSDHFVFLSGQRTVWSAITSEQ